MASTLSRLLDTMTWHLAPGRCVLCGLSSQRRRDLCAVCEQDLPGLIDPCPRCALPLPAGTTICGPCLQHPPRYASLHAACRYDDPADLLVQALKFRSLRPAARVMAEVMVDRLGLPLPRDGWLLPVPLHRWRQWQRGFNQSALLAAELGRLTGLPILTHGVRRCRATTPQSGLDRKARRRNLARAFATTGRPLPGRIILIDDVVTTGTTLDVLCQTLMQAGSEEVHAWCFARTPTS